MPLLSVQALSTGHRQALHSGLHFELERGEALILVGPNGGGKTTLLRTLLGLLKPLAGRIELQGIAVPDRSKLDLARTVAYVPQLTPPAFAFSVTELVSMGRRARLGIFGQPGKIDRAIVNDCLDWLGITHLARRQVHQLSGGERQLVMIARALTQQPELLVMDEPTASLDFGNQARVLATLQRLKSSGKTLIFSSHHPEQAARVADRALLLQRGSWELTEPQCLLNTSRLARLYEVDEDILLPMLSMGCAVNECL